METVLRRNLRSALFTSAAVVAALVSRYGGEALVPFSLMPLVAMLAGGVLGPVDGAKSMALYLGLGLVGVPVFAKPPYGGPAYLFSPTFGFLLGFILQAYVAGAVIRFFNGTGRYVLAMVLSVPAGYATGLPYLYLILNYHLGQPVDFVSAVKIGMAPFIAFDLLKAVLAAFLAREIQKRIRFFPQ